MESETGNTETQPELYVISHYFEHTDEDTGLTSLLDNLTTNWQDLQQISWLKYWKTVGEALLQREWRKKYANYLAEVKDEYSPVESPCILSPSEDLSSVESAHTHTDAWQDLWKLHVLEVCKKQWEFYTELYYNCHTDIKKSFEHEIYKNTAASDASSEQEDDEVVEDFEKLKLLGLPTSFGGRPQNCSRKKPTKVEQYYLTEEEDDQEEDDSTDSEGYVEMPVVEGETCLVHGVQQTVITRKKKKNKNRMLRHAPAYMQEDKAMLRYWRKRFSLFSRFDEGIRLDRESWFSVTPEKVAQHLAERLTCDIIVDGFCGCGGNTIQFALTCRKVYAIDIDPEKLALAKHNAQIYGVAEKIEFINADFLKFCESTRLRADKVFLSPPWGGPGYKRKTSYDIQRSLLPVSATTLMEKAQKLSKNIAFYLPRNSNMPQVISLAGPGNKCEVEHSYLDKSLVAITAFYGNCIDAEHQPQQQRQQQQQQGEQQKKHSKATKGATCSDHSSDEQSN